MKQKEKIYEIHDENGCIISDKEYLVLTLWTYLTQKGEVRDRLLSRENYQKAEEILKGKEITGYIRLVRVMSIFETKEK